MGSSNRLPWDAAFLSGLSMENTARLTSHPLASAGLAFTFNIALFMVHFFHHLFRPGDIEMLWVEHVSAIHHMVDELSRGILDLRVLVFWASPTLLSLFVATRVLERRRWS